MTTASRKSPPHSTARWAPPGGWLRSWRTTSSPTAACGSLTHWFHSSAPRCWNRPARPSHRGCHVGEGGASRLERDTSGPRGEADRVIPPAQHGEVQYFAIVEHRAQCLPQGVVDVSVIADRVDGADQ